MKKISYDPLWKLLIEKEMCKSDLIVRARLYSSTIRKLNHDKSVTVNTLLRICSALDCDFSDIIECVDDVDENK